MTGILAKRINYDTDRHRGRRECLMKTEAEIWMMCPQTSKYQRLLTKYRKLGKRLGYTLPVLSEEINFAKPWVLDFCLPEQRDDELLFLKTLSTWQFITTTLIYWYTLLVDPISLAKARIPWASSLQRAESAENRAEGICLYGMNISQLT